MLKSKLVDKLKKMGIVVTGNTVKRSDLSAVRKILADDAEEEGEVPDDADLDWLMEECDIGDDGMNVFNLYLNKHGRTQASLEDARRVLDDWKSDVEEYAMPAVEKMLEKLDDLGIVAS